MEYPTIETTQSSFVFLRYVIRHPLPTLPTILTMLFRQVLFYALLPISLVNSVSVSSQDNAEEYHCGRQTYGSPNIVDCHPLLESFANHQDNVHRVFDEEQMRVDEKGSWPGVIGIVGAAHLSWVIQVPRYYTLSMYDRPKRYQKIPKDTKRYIVKERWSRRANNS